MAWMCAENQKDQLQGTQNLFYVFNLMGLVYFTKYFSKSNCNNHCGADLQNLLKLKSLI